PTLIGVVGDHGEMAQICWRTGARNCTRPCHSNRATPGQRPARGSGPSAQDMSLSKLGNCAATGGIGAEGLLADLGLPREFRGPPGWTLGAARSAGLTTCF